MASVIDWTKLSFEDTQPYRRSILKTLGKNCPLVSVDEEGILKVEGSVQLLPQAISVSINGKQLQLEREFEKEKHCLVPTLYFIDPNTQVDVCYRSQRIQHSPQSHEWVKAKINVYYGKGKNKTCKTYYLFGSSSNCCKDYHIK